MFDESIIGSFGYHLWFISTILQFYLLFPFLIQIKNKLGIRRFAVASLISSVCYWIVITFLNFSDQRISNSSSIQFLWEFNLGIIYSDLYLEKKIKIWKTNNYTLITCAVFGIAMMGILAVKGGSIGKVFNDIPAAIGFLCISLLIYNILKNTLRFYKTLSFTLEMYLMKFIYYTCLFSW
jgi:peptidoglycan/LPS O-acetylase OafA/YrhL